MQRLNNQGRRELSLRPFSFSQLTKICCGQTPGRPSLCRGPRCAAYNKQEDRLRRDAAGQQHAARPSLFVTSFSDNPVSDSSRSSRHRPFPSRTGSVLRTGIPIPGPSSSPDVRRKLGSKACLSSPLHGTLFCGRPDMM